MYLTVLLSAVIDLSCKHWTVCNVTKICHEQYLPITDLLWKMWLAKYSGRGGNAITLTWYSARHTKDVLYLSAVYAAWTGQLSVFAKAHSYQLVNCHIPEEVTQVKNQIFLLINLSVLFEMKRFALSQTSNVCGLSACATQLIYTDDLPVRFSGHACVGNHECMCDLQYLQRLESWYNVYCCKAIVECRLHCPWS